jgi:NitT/TauT family transport system substrate-binding protein
LLEKSQAAQQAATKPEFTFSESERTAAASREATLTKPVTVGFAVGASRLSKRAEQTVDEEMVPFIENNGSAYFEVSGNTDSTGARDLNMRLSQQRAQSVVDYLVSEWEFERARFQVTGKGPDAPLCNESNPGAEGMSLEECRAANRTTRVAVLTR